MSTLEAPESARDRLQRLTPGLRRFARALVGGRARPAIADDLVHHALVAALPQRALDDGAMKEMLYADVVQGNRARGAPAAETDAPPRRTLRPGVAQALDRLPLDEREALLLVVVENFSWDETAAILGLPRSSVAARLMRARAALAGEAETAPTRAPHLRVVK